MNGGVYVLYVTNLWGNYLEIGKIEVRRVAWL